MTKALRKTIVKRSKLKSRYFKNQIGYDFELYKNRKTTVANCIKKDEGDIAIL